jgi:L1 cell adhesion molecule like protein
MGELLDVSLCAGEGQVAEVRRCMEIGLLCVQEKPADRPGMPDVLGMLNGEKAPVTPIRPEYVTKRRDRAARRARAFSCFQGIGG